MTPLETAPAEHPAMPSPPTRRRVTQRHPRLYPWAVRAHRLERRARWALATATGTRWAKVREQQELAHRVTKHGSLLLRRLQGVEMELQHHKVVNLRLASRQIDGLLIRPGETFSFNRVVGDCTRRKGYVEGMRLSNGAATSGVGGGICQLANLLHWMVLHSPLTVVERSEHSFDPFPDHRRVLPWGVGCSIVYNYVDLVVRNDTGTTFQLRAWVGERHLRGELRADESTPYSYSVQARAEELLRTPSGDVYRRNEIWRQVFSKRTGRLLGEECVKRNCALVTYEPDPARVRDWTAAPRRARRRSGHDPAPQDDGPRP